MKQPISKLKEWFGAFKMPTANQFGDWIDSYWHKDSKIPASNVEGWSDDSAVILEPGVMELPDLGNQTKNKTVRVLGGPAGKTFTYKGAQLPINPNYEGILFWTGATRIWGIQDQAPMPAQEGVDIINPSGNAIPKEKAVAIYAAKKDDFESVLNQLPLQEVKKVNDTISQTYESGYYMSSAGVKTKSTDSNRRLYSIDVLPGDIVYANSINHTTPNYVTVDINGSVLAVGPTGSTSNPSKFELILKVNLESKVYVNTNGLSEIFVVRNKVNASGESNKVYTPDGSIITREGWAYLEIDVDREDTVLYNVYNKSTTTVIFFGDDGTVETIVPLLGSTLVNRYGRYNVQKSGKVIANYFLGNDSYMLKIGKKNQLVTYSPFLRAADIQGVSESNWNEGSVFFDKNIDSNGNYLNTPKGCVLRKRLIAGEIASYSILNTNTPAAIFVSDNNVISNVSNDVGEISAEFIATENGYLYANHIDVLHPYKMTSLGGKLTKGKLISSTGVISNNTAYNLVEIPFVIGDIVTISGKKPSDTNPAIVLKIGTAYSLLSLTDSFFVKYSATAVGSLFVNTTDFIGLKVRKSNNDKVIINNDYANIGDKQFFIWFDDNFEGNSLDRNKWKYRLGEKSKGNNLSRNVIVADGKLKIILKEEASFIENENGVTDIPSTKAFTCGGIISQKQIYHYGYYECSMKAPKSTGWHSAFWTTQDFINSAESSTTMNEIDILESDSNGQVNGSTHHIALHQWTPRHITPNAYQSSYTKDCEGTVMPNFSLAFNTFGALVDEEKVTYYFNRKRIAELYYQGLFPNYTVNPAEILMTCLAHRDNISLDGLPEDSCEFEYVRYYKKID